MQSCIAGSTKLTLAGSSQDQPSSTASREHQPEEQTASQPDVASTSKVEQVQSLPQVLKQQSTKLGDTQQPHGPSAQQAASAEPLPAAQTHESHLHESESNSASHPNTIAAIRCYAKGQVRWLLNNISQSFRSGNKDDDALLQSEPPSKHTDSK